MGETEFPGVQHLPRKFSRAFASINFVAKNRMPEVMQVHANLVSPSTVQHAFDKADSILRFHHAIIGACGPTAVLRHGHALTMLAVPSDARVDNALRLSHRARDEREINFFHHSFGELSREVLMRRIIFRDDQATAGLLVQPMHNAGTLPSSNPTESAAMCEQSIY